MHIFGPTHGWGMGFGLIVSIVIAVVVIWLIVKHLMLINNVNIKNESALDILKQRYARGGIDKKEFEERKKDLQ